MDSYNGPLNKVEILNNIFMADKGNIKILLLKKNTDPYKGYWVLPRGILEKDYSVNDYSKIICENLTGLKDIDFFENAIFSDVNRINDERVIGISCIGLTDIVTVSIKKEDTEIEYNWFDIKSLPKMIFDHTDIANRAILDLKKVLTDYSLLKKLFPSDFTLPELQKVFETLGCEELDRRNFRKKLMSLDILEATGENNIGESGRPARLYRFKDK